MKKTSILIVVLIGIALVLGVLIYQGTSVSTPEAPPGTGKTSTAPSRGLADISAKIPKSISDPKEREALTPLSDDAPREEQIRYGTLINELAQNANPVGLKEECVMQPLVVRVQSGSALVFRNNDAVAHQIIIDKEPITVPAGKEGKVIASFQHGKGFYTTACYEVGADGNVLVESERFIGVLVVE